MIITELEKNVNSTPLTNRGVSLQGVSIDYIAGTFFEKGIIEVTKLFGCKDLENIRPKNFYENGIRCNDTGLVFLWSPGKAEMGVHVIASGKVVDVKMIPAFSKARISRLDICLDDREDKNGQFEKLYQAVEKEEYTGNYRNFKLMRSKKNGRVGKTIYIGSRSSEKMIRIYDKAAEQNQDGVWIRYEIETKGAFADQCFRKIKEAGRILRGVLSQFKPVEKTHTRNTNCKVAGWWKEFCDDALILKIVRTKPEMTIQRIVTWAKKQVSRNIFKMVEKLGMEIVYDLILIGEERQERLKWSGSAV